MTGMGYSSANGLHNSHVLTIFADSQAKLSDLSEGSVFMGESLDAVDVVDRLREVHQVKTDRALSEVLGVPGTTVSSWRSRNRVPFEECVAAVRKFRVSFDWLLLGQGAIDGPKKASRVLPDGISNERVQRITAFLAHWDATRSDDEQVWLEMQLARAVPEYAEWLIERAKP